MSDALSGSLNRYIATEGEYYANPARLAKMARTSALRKKGIRKLKVKEQK